MVRMNNPRQLRSCKTVHNHINEFYRKKDKADDNVLFNTITSYCSWIYNRCPVKNTELVSNILLVVCSCLLVFIRYCVPLVYNNETTFPFLFYPFCNLAILGHLGKTDKVIKGINDVKKTASNPLKGHDNYILRQCPLKNYSSSCHQWHLS